MIKKWQSQLIMMGIFEGHLHQKGVFLLGKYNFTALMLQISF
ncbi:hypothetical protein CHCC20488_0095 [Bacillus paralicheniformis]|uniref:Uncharacterized protein n=1 Tax=Bacillus paralicheniformis TaxID=1648923 RepID=A0A6I7U3Y2_9BACI|nr:hypothetical protein SC10_B2orf03123 [Bacillus paralicheniformis]OLF87958.1 hypothetical protein B4121_4410 [Bacillus paralicheniformis]OLG07452.1 hypothetical protein B4125_1633 [Bacillus paralicheniformis]TWJ78525.1 hypothetical protein CHCC20497_2533 [Bacillus paralicheniformis]TWK41574.1 hypothetical protein CHCC20347_0175 [Bacillus paralicheniformis]